MLDVGMGPGPASEAVAQRCSVRKGVLRNLAKFTGKHLCRWLLLQPLINMEFRVNTCKVSDFTEANFKDVLKISFVTQFVNSRYEMYC